MPTRTALFSEPFTEEIDVQRKQDNIKGLAVTVLKPDGSIEMLTRGISSEEGAPVTYNTIFNLGSCSKAFLAASLAILMDDFSKKKNTIPLPRGLSELTWETKVKHLFPQDWKLKDEWATEKLNIKDLLSHTWGLPRSDNALDPNSDILDTIKRLQYLRPVYELRQKWCYSNIPYIVGAYIISEYSGMPYPNFLRERVLKPLGMNSTFCSPEEIESHRDLSHAWTAEGRRLPYWFDEKRAALAAGAASVASSPIDLGQWLKFFVNEGVIPERKERLISEASFKVITNANVVVTGSSDQPLESIVGYGIGWQRLSYRAHEIVEHTGLAPGFCTYIAFLPGDRFGIALNSNTYVSPIILRSTALGIIHRILGINDLHFIPGNLEPSRKSLLEKEFTEDTLRKASPLPLKLYSGSFFNKGYGELKICSPSCLDWDCKDVLDAFSAVDRNHHVENHQLFSKWEKLWSTHLRFVHCSGNLFSFRPAVLYPDGYGKDSTPFEINFDFLEGEMSSNAEVEFVVKENKVMGFGIFGYVPKDVKLRRGGSVEEDALVYFSRTSDCCSSRVACNSGEN
ncbi:beta-lactamase/transpeptidase-like protein [Schizopora paradoxa]|uniref:Beta-lactamase/transpeptidase-like protein n=1 Tax=Schizopora paradoxa TaxID=27342 RepID=A0A0H2SCJ6_9AGAM|nr:beta-lactamase/transpeptidase-like protein [Schizopora paradoxa]